MYDKILSDLQQRFPDPLLTPEQVAEVIKTDTKTQANMRSSGTFPMPVRKLGKKVFVSVYDLAKFINGDFDNNNDRSIIVTKSTTKKKKSDYDWLMFKEQVLLAIDMANSKSEHEELSTKNKAVRLRIYKRIGKN